LFSISKVTEKKANSPILKMPEILKTQNKKQEKARFQRKPGFRKSIQPLFICWNKNFIYNVDNAIGGWNCCDYFTPIDQNGTVSTDFYL
jgi:hypothetical protein